jgi:hypothetical protein
MSIVGADLAELSTLVTRLGGPDRQQLTTVLNEMNTAVQDSGDYWVSEYGDRFRGDFARFVTSTQKGLDDMLAQAAQITRQNLDAIATATGEGSGQHNGRAGLTASDVTASDVMAAGIMAAGTSHGSSVGEDILVGALGTVGIAGAVGAVGMSYKIFGETMADVAEKIAQGAAQDGPGIAENAAEDLGDLGEFL